MIKYIEPTSVCDDDSIIWKSMLGLCNTMKGLYIKNPFSLTREYYGLSEDIEIDVIHSVKDFNPKL